MKSYIFFQNITKVVKVKIRKKNALNQTVDLAADNIVVPYCGFLYAMWKDIMIDINQKPSYTSHGFYDIMTYLKILYTAPNDLKAKRMLNSLWFRDIAAGHSVITNNQQLNQSQYYRQIRAARSALMELNGKLMVDCFDTERPVPENVSLGIKFFPNEAKKCVLADAALQPVVEIQDFYLIVPRIKPKPSLLGAPARLPWLNTEVHRYMFSAGSTNFGPRSIIHTDALPRRCIVAILTEEQLNGQVDRCRQAFDHHDVDKLLVTVNGNHLPTLNGYTPEFNKNAYSVLYDSLFQELGSESTIDITREDFSGGFVVYAFDLSQRNLSSSYYPPKKAGQAELEIHFREAPTRNLAILVFIEEERVFAFDKRREFTDKRAVS